MMTYTTLTESNNAVLYAPKAMPMKDITSTNESQFSMDRRQYMKTIQTITNFNINLPKKWYGGTANRDASHIIQNQRIQNTGKGSLNSSGNAFSFTTKNDPNTIRDALIRVRHIGSAAPAKKIHKYTNPPIFY
jgi:hypothetical protein